MMYKNKSIQYGEEIIANLEVDGSFVYYADLATWINIFIQTLYNESTTTACKSIYSSTIDNQSVIMTFRASLTFHTVSTINIIYGHRLWKTRKN